MPRKIHKLVFTASDAQLPKLLEKLTAPDKEPTFDSVEKDLNNLIKRIFGQKGLPDSPARKPASGKPTFASDDALAAELNRILAKSGLAAGLQFSTNDVVIGTAASVGHGAATPGFSPEKRGDDSITTARELSKIDPKTTLADIEAAERIADAIQGVQPKRKGGKR